MLYTSVATLAQHRGLVAAAGADLEHAAQLAGSIARAAQQQLDHARHHVGLGDRLAQADRQAGVFVGLVHQRAVDEAMPLHGAHRGEHAARRQCPARRASAPCARAPPASRGRCRRATRRGDAAPPACGACAPRRRTASSRAGKPGRRDISRPAPRADCAAAWRPVAQCVVVGQVHLQRRDGHMALRRGVEIGALGIVLGRPGAADPVHGFAVRAGLRDHFLRRMAAPQAADLEGLELFVRQVRDVDVEQPGRVVGRGARRACAAPARAPCAPRRPGGPSPSASARKRWPGCRTGSLPSRRPRCPSRWCRRPCWRRC